jgi:hypothetical protein
MRQRLAKDHVSARLLEVRAHQMHLRLRLGHKAEVASLPILEAENEVAVSPNSGRGLKQPKQTQK